jgi:hypothetical protein
VSGWWWVVVVWWVGGLVVVLILYFFFESGGSRGLLVVGRHWHSEPYYYGRHCWLHAQVQCFCGLFVCVGCYSWPHLEPFSLFFLMASCKKLRFVETTWIFGEKCDGRIDHQTPSIVLRSICQRNR